MESGEADVGVVVAVRLLTCANASSLRPNSATAESTATPKTATTNHAVPEGKNAGRLRRSLPSSVVVRNRSAPMKPLTRIGSSINTHESSAQMNVRPTRMRFLSHT